MSLNVPRFARKIAIGVLTGASLLALSACNASATPPGQSGTPASASSASETQVAIGADRCAKNRAAGTITYLTGYQYQASASILDVVAAADLGYFSAQCLNVEIQPGNGDVQGNAKLVAAGTASISGMGSDMDVMQAIAGGIKVTQVATEGHQTIDTLLTAPGVTDLKQLEGKTLGHKGTLGPTQAAMLRKAGVDLSKVTQVKVGFDPMVLARGQVQALTAYKSNEPLTLTTNGVKFKEWDPTAAGVQGSFGAIVVNPEFATKNPTAVEDFLRATAYAFEHCAVAENASKCVGFAAKRSTAGYDLKHNEQVWQKESALANASAAGGALFAPVESELDAQAKLLQENGVLAVGTALSTYVDARFANAIYVGGKVTWPGSSSK